MAKIILIIRIGIMVVTLIVCFGLWSTFPEIVPVHFSLTGVADGVGNKRLLLLVLLIPLFGLLPVYEQKKIEFHSNEISEEMISMLEIEEKNKKQIIQMIVTIILCAITLCIFCYVKTML